MNYDQLYQVMETYLPQSEIEEVHKAYLFARNAHEDQFRKSGEPYIIHPLEVTGILAKLELPITVLIAGLLHDVVEDTDITLREIESIYGETVSEIVDGVTKLGKISGVNTRDYQAENQRKIILATARDVRVILVKLADRIHNMRTIKHMNDAKQKVIATETLEVYAPIAHRLGMYEIKWELEDLSLKVINREAYNQIKDQLNMKRDQREEIVEFFSNHLESLIKDQDINALIYGRSKSFYSIYKKMRDSHKSFDEIQDLFGFRVIVDTIPECYTVLGIVHENFKPIPNRFKDYMPTPKHNTYQSIHTTILTKRGIPIELQIRTKSMHEVAEYGIAAHWKYKEGINEKEVNEKMQKINKVKEMLLSHKIE